MIDTIRKILFEEPIVVKDELDGILQPVSGTWLIALDTKRICVQKRADNGKFSNWGGKGEENESPLTAALRELEEETQLNFDGKIKKMFQGYAFSDKKIRYQNFIAIIPTEVKPIVNKPTVDGDIEVTAYYWLTIDEFIESREFFIEGIISRFSSVINDFDKAYNYIKDNI